MDFFFSFSFSCCVSQNNNGIWGWVNNNRMLIFWERIIIINYLRCQFLCKGYRFDHRCTETGWMLMLCWCGMCQNLSIMGNNVLDSVNYCIASEHFWCLVLPSWKESWASYQTFTAQSEDLPVKSASEARVISALIESFEGCFSISFRGTFATGQ